MTINCRYTHLSLASDKKQEVQGCVNESVPCSHYRLSMQLFMHHVKLICVIKVKLLEMGSPKLKKWSPGQNSSVSLISGPGQLCSYD